MLQEMFLQISQRPLGPQSPAMYPRPGSALPDGNNMVRPVPIMVLV